MGAAETQEIEPMDTLDVTTVKSLTERELELLQYVDSRWFGLVRAGNTSATKFKQLLAKATKCMECYISSRPKEQINPRVHSKLGHLYLLQDKYTEALNAYQEYYALDQDYWKDACFLYGLGLVYLHFNCLTWCIKAFNQLLYAHPDFSCSNEVHIRLGIVFKALCDYPSVVKHLNLALVDSSPCSFASSQIKFHLAHLYEIQGKHSKAKDSYEKLLNDPSTPVSVKAEIYKQLGWMYQTIDSLGEIPTRQTYAINCLKKAIELDNSLTSTSNDSSNSTATTTTGGGGSSTNATSQSGQSLYFLGRCYASQGQVHEAFISYRSSVDKTEANADTWCSIGVLYQQQSQPMDALQAYICSVQLDKGHWSAWTNLGILYESFSQPHDALKCYLNADQIKGSFNPGLSERIKFLQNQLVNSPAPPVSSTGSKLPCIEEAWNIPITQEMVARAKQHQHQMQQQQQQQQQSNVHVSSPFDDNCLSVSKKSRLDTCGDMAPLSASEMNTLVKLQQQQNMSTLSPQQQNYLKELQRRLHLSSTKSLSNYSTSCSTSSSSSSPSSSSPSSSSSISCPTSVQTSHSSHLKHSLPSEPKIAAPTCKVPADRISNGGDIESLLFPKNSPAASLAEDLIQEFELESSKDVLGSKLTLSETSHEYLKASSTANINNQHHLHHQHVHQQTSSSSFHATSNNASHRYRGSHFSSSSPQPVLSIDMKASEILTRCSGLGTNGCINSSILHDDGRPPEPPASPYPPVNRDKLLPPTPSVFIDNRKEAFSLRLQEFCLAHPIAVVRGLTNVIKLDLSLFSTKTLVEANPDHQIELRTQHMQPSDENWDNERKHQVWKCESTRTHTTIARYAYYQASSFQDSLRDEQDKAHGVFRGESDSDSNSSLNPPGLSSIGGKNVSSTGPAGKRSKKSNLFKIVKFGTNVDLSDENKWRAQLQELMKLPAFARVVSAGNMLSHVGHTILGMNSVQLYMKVPGCRTPGHQENNNYCSVNINIGPGDCEWFGVPDEYWGVLHRMCLKNGLNYVHGSWWPLMDDLAAAKVPVYRFLQKPGDLVWVNAGTIHWVQAVGWCNNIAWNVGPLTQTQYQLAIERYEWNKLEKFKSIVPMLHLTWNLARNIKVSEETLFKTIKRVLVRSLRTYQMLIDFIKALGKEIKWHGRAKDEPAHYCSVCELEVFNILFVKEVDKKHAVHCVDCARKISPVLEGFVILEEYSREDLLETYDSFSLFTPTITATNCSSSGNASSLTPTNLSCPTGSVPTTPTASAAGTPIPSTILVTNSVSPYVNQQSTTPSANVTS